MPSTSKTPASKHAAARSESIGSYGSLDKMFSTKATKRRIDLLDSSDEEVDHMEENLGGKSKAKAFKGLKVLHLNIFCTVFYITF